MKDNINCYTNSKCNWQIWWWSSQTWSWWQRTLARWSWTGRELNSAWSSWWCVSWLRDWRVGVMRVRGAGRLHDAGLWRQSLDWSSDRADCFAHTTQASLSQVADHHRYTGSALLVGLTGAALVLDRVRWWRPGESWWSWRHWPGWPGWSSVRTWWWWWSSLLQVRAAGGRGDLQWSEDWGLEESGLAGTAGQGSDEAAGGGAAVQWPRPHQRQVSWSSPPPPLLAPPWSCSSRTKNRNIKIILYRYKRIYLYLPLCGWSVSWGWNKHRIIWADCGQWIIVNSDSRPPAELLGYGWSSLGASLLSRGWWNWSWSWVWDGWWWSLSIQINVGLTCRLQEINII